MKFKLLSVSRIAVLLSMFPLFSYGSDEATAQLESAIKKYCNGSPLQLMVPYPAGGTTDVIFRLLFQLEKGTVIQNSNAPGVLRFGKKIVTSLGTTYSDSEFSLMQAYDAFNKISPNCTLFSTNGIALFKNKKIYGPSAFDGIQPLAFVAQPQAPSGTTNYMHVNELDDKVVGSFKYYKFRPWEVTDEVVELNRLGIYVSPNMSEDMRNAVSLYIAKRFEEKKESLNEKKNVINNVEKFTYGNSEEFQNLSVQLNQKLSDIYEKLKKAD